MNKTKQSISYNYVLSTQDFVAKQYEKKSAKSWFGKLGSSLTLVVEVLPFAGLFAAIGGILIGDATTEAMYTAGLVFSDIGQTVLANLGLLFMFSIILGFTDAKGFSIYSAIVGYIAFVGFMLPFIRYNPVNVTDTLGNIIGVSHDPASAQTFNIWFWKHLDVSTQMSSVLGFGQGPVVNPDLAKGQFVHLSYEGVKTVNTGVLGGIALGFIYAWLYNKTKDLKLPAILSFFEGEKFTSVICLITAPIVSALFIIVWPGVNYVLGEIGFGLIDLPGGLDSFFFALIKYWLLPFQAHAAFYSPLWWTSAGGQISTHQLQIVEAMIDRVMTGHTASMFTESTFYNHTILPDLQNTFGTYNGVSFNDALKAVLNGGQWATDPSSKSSVVWDAISPYFDQRNISQATQATIKDNLQNYGTIKWTTVGDQTMTMELLNNDPWFDMRDAWSANLKVTRFISGGFANLMFATPAIGFAMWGTLDKDRRRKFFPLYWGAVIPCLILGVSEPIMFMFCFIMPGIYFIWYTPFYAILFWVGSIFQVKLGSTFSQGGIDYIINGIIPTFTRTHDGVSQTKFWEPLVMGAISFPIAYYLFKLIFIKSGFAAPGSLAAEQSSGTLESSVYKETKPKLDGVLDYFGKKKNIASFKYNGKNKLSVVLKKPVVDRTGFIDKQYIKKSFVVDNVFEITLKNVGPYMKKALKLIERLVNIQNYVPHNSGNVDVKKEVKLAKINAYWILRQEKLDNQTDEEKLTYNHELRVWEIKHLKENQINKVLDKEPIPFSSTDRELLKQENESYKKSLEAFDKKKIKAKEKKLLAKAK